MLFDFLFRSKHKRHSDMADARELMVRYGGEALSVARERAGDSHLSLRNRRHWSRVSRMVTQLTSKAKRDA